MKNFISNFIKGIGVMTIAVGIIYAADLTLTSGQPITEKKWSDLVTEITGSTTKNIVQDTSITSATTKVNTNASDIADLLAEINALKTQVSGLATANNVYTKTQVNNLLGAKANTSALPNMTNYYTKTQSNNLLAGKAAVNHNHNNLYYTESEMNTKLNGKANINHTHPGGTISGSIMAAGYEEIRSPGPYPYYDCGSFFGSGTCSVNKRIFSCPSGTRKIKTGSHSSGPSSNRNIYVCIKE